MNLRGLMPMASWDTILRLVRLTAEELHPTRAYARGIA